MNAEEKTLILGALFHDIGKFEQRCTGNPSREKHPLLGVKLIGDGRFLHRFEKIVGQENIDVLKNIISEHHNNGAKGLTSIVREADRLSASERVDKEEVEAYQDQWQRKHLSSLFSKIKILSKDKITARYYKHQTLSKIDYSVIIPSETDEKDIKDFSYKESDWNLFKEDLEYVLDTYVTENDFDSLINLLLIIFEKYMWCIPDFTGSSETDISLYNHLKDVAGLSHAIKLSRSEKADSKYLNLIIGDIPGIQNYIFDVINKKPAKILRGRSIFVQVLTRNLATKLLKSFGLTEVNLIMLAGGKFYIIAPDTENFRNQFQKVKTEINDYLYNDFRMELSFNCAYKTFDFSFLMDKKNPLTFGQVVEEASHKLIENRYNLFNEKLFPNNKIIDKEYVWRDDYIKGDGSGSDSVKCGVTDKPIRKGRLNDKTIKTETGYLNVDEQVATEYKIGDQITKDDFIIFVDKENLLKIYPDEMKRVDNYSGKSNGRIKLLLNPSFEKLKEQKNKNKNFFNDFYYLEVANYCTEFFNKEENKETVMQFDEMVKGIEGAKFLTLIKGDIDNLGLIMAYGLSDDEDDLTGISRTTTLSNHLKYYYSFFLNGFLKDWELQNKENKVYTVFAGGDDLMLVTPQSSAIKLIKALNDKFEEFACNNNEVHISYSVTLFKDHSPIRVISDIAEVNQKEGKKYSSNTQNKLFKDESEKKKAFLSENDKAGTFIFDSFIKNQDLHYFAKQVEYLTFKANDERTGLSRGLIRRLLELSEMMKKYDETDDATYLIAYARLNYSVNRLLKDRDTDIKKFFENVLTINKDGNEDAKKLEKILHPLVCQVIYNIR